MGTLGTEYFIKDNISLSAEYGFRNTSYPNSDSNVLYLKEKASTYRFETKFYNNINLTNNVHLNEYLALEVRTIKSQYNDYINYTVINDIDTHEYITDDFATKKTVTIINLKYGLLVPIGEKFYFDFYSGLGVRTKKYQHINLEYNKLIHQTNFSDDISLFDYKRFKSYEKKSFLNYSLGFKFGIKL
ncbi:hypothetical protein [Polaribacter sp. Hel1_85]|uniref:hypothetical protein n=1 Tax=Polaribacter sp. Hel1_85 TaxID=1250005 RepID=UPI00052C976E|nr:hypothetical protein [Polaribacter sp. Hel1_85]KGL62891.1 hypothetical protein PHEL85_2687 [Polaribacter sp. Hel1_85]